LKRCVFYCGAIADYKSGKDSCTPLYWTAQRQDLKAVDILLSHHANPNQLTGRSNPLVAFAAMATISNGKNGTEFEWLPRDATSDLILVALLRRGVEHKHIRTTLIFHVSHNLSPATAQRSVLQKVREAKPAWYEVCSAIMNLKLCKCLSVAYCSKECQRADWKKHKLVCAGKANEAVLTEERAAIARDEQRKKVKSQKKRVGGNEEGHRGHITIACFIR
jgi:hypothetical protein